jgi:hypothetical protein
MHPLAPAGVTRDDGPDAPPGIPSALGSPPDLRPGARGRFRSDGNVNHESAWFQTCYDLLIRSESAAD